LKNLFLCQVFPFAVNLQNDPDFPILGFLMSLAWMDQKTAGYLVSGSLEFERRYLGSNHKNPAANLKQGQPE
jgi:hypothetical protein